MKLRNFAIILFVSIFIGTLAHAQEWKEYKRQHFIIYYKEVPFNFVEAVEKAAEEYYLEITNNLGFTRHKGWNWDDRAIIYIYDNADDYVESGKQAGWSHGVASPLDRTIRTFPSAHGFFDSTLPHELGHIIFREFIGFDVKIPSWFEEGVATYQEKAKRWGAHNTVREAMEQGVFQSLSELSMMRLKYKTDKAVINLFYAESASIVSFMITELGEQRFVRLCRKLKDNKPFDATIVEIYSRIKSIDDLNNEWVKYLKNE